MIRSANLMTGGMSWPPAQASGIPRNMNDRLFHAPPSAASAAGFPIGCGALPSGSCGSLTPKGARDGMTRPPTFCGVDRSCRRGARNKSGQVALDSSQTPFPQRSPGGVVHIGSFARRLNGRPTSCDAVEVAGLDRADEGSTTAATSPPRLA